MRCEMDSKKCLLGLFVFLLLLCSCSTIPNLNVNYHLPSVTGDSKPKEVTLLFKDERGTKYILSESAENEFRSFSGKMSLSVTKPTGGSVPVGLYDPGTLFTEAFRRRFEANGIKVATIQKEGRTTITIVLKRFELDYSNRKWIVRIDYEAVVKKDNGPVYRHNINGEGERLKILGTEQADALMGEIFTDVINRLDLEKISI
jgi:hypothetical protein